MAEREQDVFSPEEVDEQIDAYLAASRMNEQSLDLSAHTTVQALQRHLAPAQQDAGLQRVWQRFEQERALLHQFTVVQQHTSSQQKRRYHMNHVSSATLRKERSNPLVHRLGLVAAVIFVALLVGSMVVVFRLAPNRSIHTALSVQPAPKAMFILVNETLYRLDMKTHQPLWRFHVPAGTDGRPGSIASLGEMVNDTYYLVGSYAGTQETLYALDVAHGKVRWQVHRPGVMPVSLMISNDTVYLSSLLDDGYSLVEALNKNSGAVKWAHRLGSVHIQTVRGKTVAIAVKTTLIAASDTAVYGETLSSNSVQRFALSAQNGKSLWQKNEEIANIGAIDRGFLFDGVLVVAKESDAVENGQSLQHAFLLGYDAASGDKLWSKPLAGSPTMYGTAILNGIIYLNTLRTNLHQGNIVYAFSARDGALIWQYVDTDVSGSSYPMVTEEGVYINRYGVDSNAGQTLVALDTKTGKVRWTYNFHDGLTVEYPPAADNTQVYLSLPGNMIQILRVADGKPLGSFTVHEKVDPQNRVLLQVVG